MKKLLFIISLFLLIGLVPVEAKEKVKVYVFEAGGCPYCEAQIEYLEELQKTNSHFEIVEKELYVDHIDWKQGKDYELGVKVATAFYDAGFTNASYYGTPFVVIGNIYAAAAYSTNLEKYIEKAYEAGDNDVVACLEKSKNCDLSKYFGNTGDVKTPGSTDDKKDTDTVKDTDATKETSAYDEEDNKNDNVLLYVLVFVGYGFIVVLFIMTIVLFTKVNNLKNSINKLENSKNKKKN